MVQQLKCSFDFLKIDLNESFCHLFRQQSKIKGVSNDRLFNFQSVFSCNSINYTSRKFKKFFFYFHRMKFCVSVSIQNLRLRPFKLFFALPLTKRHLRQWQKSSYLCIRKYNLYVFYVYHKMHSKLES